MALPPLRRAAASLVAVWFVLAVGELPAVHPCPVHSGAPGAGTVATDHGAHGAHTAQPGSGEAEPHTCTCIGHCTAASALAATAVPRVAPVAVTQVHRASPVARGIVPLHSPHSQPFANGPPHTSA
jgi:hypothetical protein